MASGKRHDFFRYFSCQEVVLNRMLLPLSLSLSFKGTFFIFVHSLSTFNTTFPHISCIFIVILYTLFKLYRNFHLLLNKLGRDGTVSRMNQACIVFLITSERTIIYSKIATWYREILVHQSI